MDEKLRISREEDVFRHWRWVGRKYYDAPDGEDLVGKITFTTKIGAAIGWNISLIQIMNRPPFQLYRDMFLRSCKTTAITVGMAAAGTITIYYATRLREVDDTTNHFLGGIAAGAVFGASVGSTSAGVCSSILLGIIAALKKVAHSNESKLGYVKPPSQHYLPSVRNMLNFSVMPQIKGNWASVKPDN